MQHYNLQTIDDLLGVIKDPAIIEDKIIKWLVSLQSTGVTYGTRHTYMCALVMFYEINDIIIRKKKISRFLGEESTRKNKDRAYTIEEIRKLLDHASIRDKALVLLLASTGMRIGAIENLKLKHLAKKVPSNRNSNHPHLYRITVYENTREEYNTYSYR
jgi:integrase